MVLAGGLGTRIRSTIGTSPKALAPVAGRAFIEFPLGQLRRAGLGEVVVLTGHGAGELESYLTSHRYGVAFSRETSALGTGGAVALAASRFPARRYLVLNGDSVVDVDLNLVAQDHSYANAANGAIGTIVATTVPDSARFGEIEVNGDGFVAAFKEKTGQHRPGLINAGVYVLERAVVEQIPIGIAVSLEHDTFPKLIGKGLRAMTVEAPFIDIGVAEDYAVALKGVAWLPDIE